MGVALGVAGTVLVSRWAGPTLMSAFQGSEAVEGRVLDKALESDRLLLKIETEDGVLLATFTERQAQIDLLVDPGDTLALDAREYRPFLEDPGLARVRKPKPPHEPEETPVDASVVEDEAPIDEPEETPVEASVEDEAPIDEPEETPVEASVEDQAPIDEPEEVEPAAEPPPETEMPE